MRKLIFSVMLIVSSLAYAAQVQIAISTDHTDMVLATNKANQLMFMYYGTKVGCPQQFEQFQSYRRSDYSTEPLAYPARGGRFFNQPALAVKYSDGDANTELTYSSHETKNISSDVKQTTVLLSDTKTSLEVQLVYTAYLKEDVIMAHAVITNKGKKDITLENYASSAINLKASSYLLTHYYGSWAREMQVEHELLTHGIKTIENKMGVRTTHTENPSFMLSLDNSSLDENHGEVIAGALAWSGNYKLQFQMDETDRLSVICGINDYASAYTLKKGATFSTPEMIWTFTTSGAGQASRNLHDWARRHYIYSKGHLAYTLLNSWEGAYFDFNTKTLTDMIDDAAAMGLEMFVLDDGWFGNEYPRNSSRAGLGDWQTNTKKIPEGIAYLADYAHKKGIKFGIWIEPEMVNPSSNLAHKHPEWIVKSSGREITTTRNQWLLDLTRPEVQDFVFSVFDETMKKGEGKIDYIKWDCNRHVESFGSTWLTEQSRFFVDYTLGLYSVMKRIREKYPNTIIQSCSSGGGRVDFGALEYFDEVWTSDNTEALSRVFIQYGTNMIYPAATTGSHVSAVPNHQTNNITPLKFRFDLASTGRMGMELQPANMTKE
ncbi:MAG: alpha-galactosidase, partial [Bacteroidaceae bacterium]|nr:alpha-galactosidase [Bacteroidaceae bacterium]